MASSYTLRYNDTTTSLVWLHSPFNSSAWLCYFVCFYFLFSTSESCCIPWCHACTRKVRHCFVTQSPWKTQKQSSLLFHLIFLFVFFSYHLRASWSCSSSRLAVIIQLLTTSDFLVRNSCVQRPDGFSYFSFTCMGQTTWIIHKRHPRIAQWTRGSTVTQHRSPRLGTPSCYHNHPPCDLVGSTPTHHLPRRIQELHRGCRTGMPSNASAWVCRVGVLYDLSTRRVAGKVLHWTHQRLVELRKYVIQSPC